MTLAAALAQTQASLAQATPTSRLEAEVLLRHVHGGTRTELLAYPERVLPAAEWRALRALIERRAAGEPIAYLIGAREFWSMELAVTPDVLIPRPETELLVDQALARIPDDSDWTIADLGTGSGAIALAIARERPRCRVIATDISAAALAVAYANSQRHGITNVEFRHGEWLAPLSGTPCNVIVSNPPYIAGQDPHLLQGDLRFEPRTALTAGANGLEAIRIIVAQAHVCLAPPGWVLLEHGYDQERAVADLARAAGYEVITNYRDLAGQPRVTEFHLARR